ncbi:MAG: MerR family transcriptional regulator [bacterium]
MTLDIPDKVFFKIGEVSRIIGVPEHTLRYWEEEFGQIRPEKTRSGQRLYRRRDIDLLLQVKDLLWEKKFKIAGAKQQLKRSVAAEQDKIDRLQADAKQGQKLQEEVHHLKEIASQIQHELDHLLKLLDETDSRGVAQSG